MNEMLNQEYVADSVNFRLISIYHVSNFSPRLINKTLTNKATQTIPNVETILFSFPVLQIQIVSKLKKILASQRLFKFFFPQSLTQSCHFCSESVNFICCFSCSWQVAVDLHALSCWFVYIPSRYPKLATDVVVNLIVIQYEGYQQYPLFT